MIEGSFDEIQNGFGKSSTTIQSKLSSSFITDSQKTGNESLLVDTLGVNSSPSKLRPSQGVTLSKPSQLLRTAQDSQQPSNPMKISAEMVQSELDIAAQMRMR